VTETHILNVACAELGLTEVSGLNEEVSHARRFKATWPIFKRAFLATHPWNGAVVVRALNSIAGTSADTRFTNVFGVPHDYIRGISVNGREDQPGVNPWRVHTTPDGFDQRLYTNESEALFEYIADIINIGLLSPLAQEAMGIALANRHSKHYLTPPLVVELKERSRVATAEAKSAESRTGTATRRTTGRLVAVRRTGHR